MLESPSPCSPRAAEYARELCPRLGQKPGDLRRRRLHESHDPGSQHLQGRQRRERGDLTPCRRDAHPRAAPPSARTPRGPSRSRRGSGPGQSGPQRRSPAPSVPRSARRCRRHRCRRKRGADRVLRNPVFELALPLAADPAPQLVRRLDVDPPVVGQVDTRGSAELLLQLGDLMLLLRSRQHRIVSYAAIARKRSPDRSERPVPWWSRSRSS